MRAPVQEPMAEQQHNARTRDIESERAIAVREGRKTFPCLPLPLVPLSEGEPARQPWDHRARHAGGHPEIEVEQLHEGLRLVNGGRYAKEVDPG